VPRGGPDGGDGGRGGDVILRADPTLATLQDFRYRREYGAKNGQGGQGSNCHGADGETLVLRVPVGTEVHDAETGELLCDLTEPDQEVVFLKGGRGGLGNQHFATPWRQAPDYAQPGEPAQERNILLVLKLLADVGLVGFPNAGKSTLVSVMSRARPKIADYPFTTLVPNLGVVRVDDERSYVMADIPGIIEGAADGAGLGLRFLRHIERTGLFLYLVTLDYGPGRDPVSDYQTLRRELAKHDPALLERPSLIVVSQVDRPDVAEQVPAIEAALGPVLTISAVTGAGMDALRRAIADRLSARGRWSRGAADNRPE
jgi:GTP-binding protein